MSASTGSPPTVSAPGATAASSSSAPNGYIELRKYIDIAGRPGKDHLFLVDNKGTQYVDCSAVDLPYGRQLIADVLNRTETAMPQARCYKAMELALIAQRDAEIGTVWAQ